MTGTINGRFELGADVATTSATTWVVCYGYTDRVSPRAEVLVTYPRPVVYLHAAPGGMTA